MILGTICYCPDLRLYHYDLRDDTIVPPKSNVVADYKFTEEELVEILEDMVSQDKRTQAEMMAILTGYGRLYPHKLVDFYTDDDGALQIKGSRDVEPLVETSVETPAETT